MLCCSMYRAFLFCDYVNLGFFMLIKDFSFQSSSLRQLKTFNFLNEAALNTKNLLNNIIKALLFFILYHSCVHILFLCDFMHLFLVNIRSTLIGCAVGFILLCLMYVFLIFIAFSNLTLLDCHFDIKSTCSLKNAHSSLYLESYGNCIAVFMF